MKLVQLTDCHLAGPGETVGGRDPRANLDAALGEVARLHADAELVVLTGDLCEVPSEATYRWLRRRLDRLGLPVALTVGNHDDRALFAAVFPEAMDADGHAQSAHALGRGTALCLDTLDQGRLGGRLDAARLGWLEAQLAAGSGPFWIFLHHNPVPTHLAPLDRIMLADPAALGAVLARHRARVAHLFHGHCHLPISGAFHGIPVASGRGTNHAGYPDFGATELPPLSDLPEAYSVIVAAGDTVSVMMVEFGYARGRDAGSGSGG